MNAPREKAAVTGKELLVRVSDGPCCPNCGCDTFDDWHLERGLKNVGGVITGRLRCHNCSRYFSIRRYSDGEVTSSMTKRRAGNVEV